MRHGSPPRSLAEGLFEGFLRGTLVCSYLAVWVLWLAFIWSGTAWWGWLLCALLFCVSAVVHARWQAFKIARLRAEWNALYATGPADETH